MKTIFKESDIEYMKNNYLTKSYKEIGIILGFSERQIRGKINNMGLKKERVFNSDYFSIINTEEKAYFLGLIFGDGWVSMNEKNRTYEFGIQLKSDDSYLLDILNNELGNVHIITHKEKCIRFINGIKCEIEESDALRIYSKRIVNDLITHGVVQNKSYVDSIPDVPVIYFYDFLRGLFDSDGCFYLNKNNHSFTITEGTESILLYVQNQLSIDGIKSRIYQENEHKYRLYVNTQDSLSKLFPLIYHSSFSHCLKRKYEKIKNSLYGSAI